MEKEKMKAEVATRVILSYDPDKEPWKRFVVQIEDEGRVLPTFWSFRKRNTALSFVRRLRNSVQFHFVSQTQEEG